MAKTTAIQKADTSILDHFRDAINQCELPKDQEAHIVRELESIGASALAIGKTKENLKKLRKKITESKEYKLEKKIKAQLKQIEKAQEAKAYKVIGVIETHGVGKQNKGLGGLAGLLEGSKE